MPSDVAEIKMMIRPVGVANKFIGVAGYYLRVETTFRLEFVFFSSKTA